MRESHEVGETQGRRRHRSRGANALRTLEWSWRRVTARWRRLPDFVVIGGQRCGTTSLFRTLQEHPGIEMSFRKESHYFDLQYRSQGRDWYRAHFGMSWSGGRIHGEATPNYLAFFGVPERMHAVIPDAKLVALVRDPVERAHSAWRYKTREGTEHRSFSDAVRQEAADPNTHAEKLDDPDVSRQEKAMQFSYLEKGHYAEHLDRWLGLYPRGQLHIAKSEDLFTESVSALRSLVEFIGADPDLNAPYPHANVAPPVTMDPADRSFLTEYFAPHNQRLEELLGTELGWS